MTKKKEIQGRKGGKKKEIDRLKGRKCTEKCKIHKEPCEVVMRYKDAKIQATLDRLQALAGVPRHEDSPFHYCELCSMALRQNRPLNAYARRPNGVIYLKHAGVSRFEEDKEQGILTMVDDEDYEEEREEE
jgi:hypothetical protein